MKKLQVKYFYTVFFFINLLVNAQMRTSDFPLTSTDTIYFYEPCGSIFANMDQSDKYSSYFSWSYQEILKKELAQSLSNPLVFFPLDEKKDSVFTLSFYERLTSISYLSKKEFDNNTLNHSTIELSRIKTGRYIGLAFFDGYIQRNYTEKVIGGCLLGMLTCIITLGNYYYMPLPRDPNSDLTLIIIDREKNKMLYYYKVSLVRDPLAPETIEKVMKKHKDAFSEALKR